MSVRKELEIRFVTPRFAQMIYQAAFRNFFVLVLAVTVCFINQRIWAASIAVEPFTTRTLQKDDNPSLREFEKLFFSYKLINALKKTGQVVYFSPGMTPATDVTLAGRIEVSNGRKTAVTIQMLAPDGSEVWSDDFDILISSKQFITIEDPADQLWVRIASRVVSELTNQSKKDWKPARVAGYANQNIDKILANPLYVPAEDLAGKASKVEQDKLLGPITLKVLSQGAAATRPYLDWQRQATPLVEQRSNAKLQGALSMFSMIVGGAAAGYGQATTGYSNPSALASMQSSANNADAANNLQYQINNQLKGLQSTFSFGSAHELVVTLYNHVYTLEGDPIHQLAQFRALVSKTLQSKLNGK